MSEKTKIAFLKWLKKPRPGFPRGWTYQHFGEITGIGYFLAAKLGSDGKRNPQPRTLRQIAAVCPDCPLVSHSK